MPKKLNNNSQGVKVTQKNAYSQDKRLQEI